MFVYLDLYLIKINVFAEKTDRQTRRQLPIQKAIRQKWKTDKRK